MILCKVRGKENLSMTASKIRLLPTEVVHRIAAGEVVENPASALKELVENSIDAEATKISVLVAEGGLRLLEVRDNGVGMTREDLESVCQRHATSKIATLDDLDSIGSLGFRGEALAALSSVSDLEILSRRRGQGEAWLLNRHGADFESKPVTASEGTIVRVKNLFAQTPARLKFLKSFGMEANRCVKTIRDLAVAHPEVEMSLHVLNSASEIEEEVFFQKNTGNFARLKRLCTVFEKEEENFLRSESQNEVTGLRRLEVYALGAPHFSRNSKDIFFIVNGRPIEDRRLPYVFREAFGGLIEVATFPRGALYLEIDPTLIDVNVHPQKKEIRWSKDFPLYSLVFNHLKRALENLRAPQANVSISRASMGPEVSVNLGPSLSMTDGGVHSSESYVNFNSQDLRPVEAKSPRFSELRIVGEVGAAWILCESSEGLIILDQHAAHERVNFDALMKGRVLLEALPLLIPLEVSLPLSMKGLEEEVLRSFESWGFEGRVLADRLIECVTVPKSPRKVEWAELFKEIFERHESHESLEALQHRLRVHIMSSVACHGSIRRGQRLSHEEISALLRSLDEVDWKEFCPHGRPTWIELSHERLEKEFHRV